MSDRLHQQLVSALARHLEGDPPRVPEAGVLLWNLFMAIGAVRTWHAAGPHAISHGEIEAYARLHRWPLRAHHIAIIRALDNAWLAHAYGREAGDPGVGARRAQAKPLTSAMFDAVFG